LTSLVLTAAVVYCTPQLLCYVIYLVQRNVQLIVTGIIQYILQLHYMVHRGYRTSPLQGVSHWDILKMDIFPRRLSNYYIITIIFAPVVVISTGTMVKLPPVASRTLVLVYDCSEGQTIPAADQSPDSLYNEIIKSRGCSEYTLCRWKRWLRT